MKQYQQKTKNPRRASPLVEAKSAANSADTALLSDRLRWTEQLVEHQRRELRRIEAVVEQLRSAIDRKLRG